MHSHQQSTGVKYWTHKRIRGAVPFENIVVPFDDIDELKRTHPWFFRLRLALFLGMKLLCCRGIGWIVSVMVDNSSWNFRFVYLYVCFVFINSVVKGLRGQESVHQCFTKQEDKDIKKLRAPYRSVGRIYATHKSKDVYVTAFYIGQPTKTNNGIEVHKLLTVAHAFCKPDLNELDTEYKNHVFIPGDQNLYNSHEIEKYPIYPEEDEVTFHPKYRPCYAKIHLSRSSLVYLLAGVHHRRHCTQYDMCVVHIKKLKRMKELQLVAYNDLDTRTSIFLHQPFIDQKIMVKGNYIRSHTITNYQPLTIQLYADVQPGMGGGPWIIYDKVCGIQSCSYQQPNGQLNPTSPAFGESLFGDEGLKLNYVTASSN